MTSTSPGIIDVHAHFVTPGYLDAARAAGLDHPDGMPHYPTWSVAEHLKLMDAIGVERAVLSISSPGVHFGDDAAAHDLSRQVNDFAAQTCADHPDRFSFFASLPLPDVEGAVTELIRSFDTLDAAGIILMSNARGQYLGDPALQPVWQELQRRRGRVLIHPTSPAGWEQTALSEPRPEYEFLFDSTRTTLDLVLHDVLEQYPDVRFVVPHCGGVLPAIVDRVALFHSSDLLPGERPDSPDTHDRLKKLWFDLAGTTLPTNAPLLVNTFGDEHVLYGSDHCWTGALMVQQQVALLDEQWGSTTETPWRELVARNAQNFFD